MLLQDNCLMLLLVILLLALPITCNAGDERVFPVNRRSFYRRQHHAHVSPRHSKKQMTSGRAASAEDAVDRYLYMRYLLELRRAHDEDRSSLLSRADPRERSLAEVRDAFSSPHARSSQRQEKKGGNHTMTAEQNKELISLGMMAGPLAALGGR